MNTTLLRRRHTRRASPGFSLAELMVVIVILGLLATLVATNVIPILFQASSTVARSDISTISSAIENYMINNGGRAPMSLDELTTPDENNNTYLKAIPPDPWKNEYVYEPPIGNRAFRVISYGKDGAPGGEGENADIDNISIMERK